MGMTEVTEGLYRVSDGGVNVSLLDAPEGLALIETGEPTGTRSAPASMLALGAMARHITGAERGGQGRWM